MRELNRSTCAPALVLGALLAGLLSACATYDERMAEVQQDYALGRYAECDAKLEELIEENAGDAQVYSLERSMVKLALGQPSEAEQLLRFARDRMDEFAKEGFDDYFGAMLLDDRQMDYGGEDYERVLVRAMLSVANLMAGGGDAIAYAHQVLEKQQELIDSFEDADGNKPKEAYKLVAFGAYLQGIIREEDPLNVDEARIHYQRVCDLEPSFRDGAADLERATKGVNARRGNGVVHIIALVGRGPFKIEVSEPVTPIAVGIAQVAWALFRKAIPFPNLTEVEIPALAYHQDNPDGVRVFAEGREVGATATVTDVEQTARQQFDTMKNWILARAILRRVFKVVVTEGAREVVNQQDNPLAGLAIAVGGLIWTAVERADTRCWSLLPASFQVLRVELSAGVHEIDLQALRDGAPSGQTQSVRVLVRSGYNTYVLALVPTMRGGPPPLTSEPASTPDTAP